MPRLFALRARLLPALRAARRTRPGTLAWAGLALLAALAARPLAPGADAVAQTRAGAQVPVSSTTAYATRAQLTAALAEAQRRGNNDEVARLQQRLAYGDVRVGDRLAITLVVDSARQYDLVVRDSQLVEVQPLGRMSLRGLLRSEVQPVAQRFFEQYYRNPEVRVRPLLRVGVTGQVQRPGYYSIEADVPITELLTERAGGGPGGNARLSHIEVKRGNQRLLDRHAYKRAARDGITLAELGIRSGDELHVPERKNRSTGQIIQNAFFGVSVLTSLIFLIRSAYGS